MQSNGEAIKAIRERSGMSKSDLARLAEVERTQVIRIENGVRNGTEEQLRRIAVALKVPTTAIIHAPREAVA